MAIKKYHVSTNLFNGALVQGSVADNGLLRNNSKRVRGEYVPVTANTTYTLSSDQSIKCIYAYNNQTGVGLIFSVGGGGEHQTTFTTLANCNQICFAIMSDTNDDITPQDVGWVMLNTGSTPQPFEPYSSEVWHTIPYRKYGTETDTLTSFPADVIADGQSASANIIGNMQQTGTPSPQSIIIPSECGDKTANLLNQSIPPENIYISSTIRRMGYEVELSAGTYTVYGNDADLYAKTKIDNIYGDASQINTALNLTLSSDGSIIVYGRVNGEFPNVNIMLNAGSTALPYKPFGYKIPILSGGTTTNVYLGEVQSTRNIKKLVLTGQETGWNIASGVFYNEALSQDYLRAQGEVTILCSHYSAYRQVSGAGSVPSGSCSFYYKTDYQRLYINDSNYSTVADFTAYLAAQYANGTPVTVWYVLATPATGIVNEPIRKIGSYSDSVSVSNIPTTGTAESFDIDTTLKPSEVQLTYHGWHEHSDKKKSANKFDDTHIINIPNVGDRYGDEFPSGTYSIRNVTNNPVYYGTANWEARSQACAAKSTATLTLNISQGEVGGFFMPLNSDSQGGCTIVSGSTVPSSYIPYWIED